MTNESTKRHDLEVLTLFNHKVAKLDAGGFAKRYANDIPSVISKFDNPVFHQTGASGFPITGRITSRLEEFNQDEIDAFCLTHRILTQNNDPISVGRLALIYEKPWMPKEARDAFNDARE